MRQIESKMNKAIKNKIAWSSGNTCTTFDSTIENCFVYLHGNHIATYNYDKKELSLFDGGWQSNTTKSRLNALLEEVKYGCRVFQKNFDWFVKYNDDIASFWDGMILIDADSLQIA